MPKLPVLPPLIVLALAISPSVFYSAYGFVAEESGAGIDLEIREPEKPVSVTEGLSAWDRIFDVVSHPRCANCHVDESNVPMWSGPSYGQTRPHGMNIVAGDDRIGATTLPCSTCHRVSTADNSVAHAAPHAGLPWQLAPVEFVWFERDSASICEQMRDPERNGGRDGDGQVEHIVHDAEVRGFITWGFNPGGGREPAPGSMQEHLDDMVTWTAAGMPCRSD